MEDKAGLGSGPAAMEFESSTPERVAAAIGFGSSGFAAIGAAYVFPDTPLFVFVLGMFLLAVGLCFATWNTVVHVERRARRVTKIQRILFWTTIERYPFASFRAVKVAKSPKTAIKLGGETLYRVKLDGVPSLTLPGSYDRRAAKEEAAGLSRLMQVGADRRRPSRGRRRRRVHKR